MIIALPSAPLIKSDLDIVLSHRLSDARTPGAYFCAATR
jgi:hypothetical protein